MKQPQPSVAKNLKNEMDGVKINTQFADWQRWNDYGIALLEQAQYGAACDAFKKAVELNPQNPDPYISAAIAELKMERFGLEKEQLKKAGNLIDQALKINPQLPRALFYRAMVWRADGKLTEAAAEFQKLSIIYPRDREVQRQLGQTLFSLNEFDGARQAFEKVLTIDPTDAGAYQILSSIYYALKLQEKAERAQNLYLVWRDDPQSEGIAAQFFVNNPQWSEVRIPFHINSFLMPQRPVAVGRQATPVE